MATKSRLQESEIHLEEPWGSIKVKPIEDRRYVLLWGEVMGNPVGLKPVQAYDLGQALVRHAEECGFDPEAA